MTATGSAGQMTRKFNLKLNQERMVVAISAVLFVVFATTLDGFLQVANILSLLQSVAVLGILAIGMGMVVIGRGIDLTMVAVMVFSVGWSFSLAAGGLPIGSALLLGFGFALLVGILNGVLIAYLDIPAIFATLAMSTVVAGVGRFALVDRDNVYITDAVGWVGNMGADQVLQIPVPVVIFCVLACVVFACLRFTKYGGFIYAMGDNPMAARNNGVAMRPMMVLLYATSAVIAFAAGVVMATTVSNVNTKLTSSTMVYDIILVVVIGGIGLSGGKGSVMNVIAGTILIGLLLNGMTIMDISYPVQNIIKSLILLLAIIVDSILNPRDEQTSQQGDI